MTTPATPEDADAFTYYIRGFESVLDIDRAVARMTKRGARRFEVRDGETWKPCTEAQFDALMTSQPDREIHFKEGQLFTTFHSRPETALAEVHQSAAKIVAELPAPFIRYAMSADRGEFAGFAALHDKCDANTLLPFADSDLDEFHPTSNQTICDFYNEVMEEVTRLMRLWMEREELLAELGRYVSNDANYTGRGKNRRISLETGKAGQMRARIVKLDERLAFYPVAK